MLRKVGTLVPQSEKWPLRASTTGVHSALQDRYWVCNIVQHSKVVLSLWLKGQGCSLEPEHWFPQIQASSDFSPHTQPAYMLGETVVTDVLHSRTVLKDLFAASLATRKRMDTELLMLWGHWYFTAWLFRWLTAWSSSSFSWLSCAFL